MASFTTPPKGETPPDPSKPYLWFDGKWVLIASDAQDEAEQGKKGRVEKDQARDERGRWTSGGSDATSNADRYVARDMRMEGSDTAMAAAKNVSAGRYDSLTDEHKEHLRETLKDVLGGSGQSGMTPGRWQITATGYGDYVSVAERSGNSDLVPGRYTSASNVYNEANAEAAEARASYGKSLTEPGPTVAEAVRRLALAKDQARDERGRFAGSGGSGNGDKTPGILTGLARGLSAKADKAESKATNDKGLARAAELYALAASAHADAANAHEEAGSHDWASHHAAVAEGIENSIEVIRQQMSGEADIPNGRAEVAADDASEAVGRIHSSINPDLKAI